MELDERASSLEAGRYLDTVRFVSFNVATAGSRTLGHVLVDGNKASLAQSLGMGVEEYPTRDGVELSEYVGRTMEHSGANEILGCAPQRYMAKGGVVSYFPKTNLPLCYPPLQQQQQHHHHRRHPVVFETYL